jgi:dTMP kinase
LVRRLREGGHEPVVTREPGGTPVGDRLRELFVDASLQLDPLCELFVVCAARAQHVRDVIGPALDQGKTIVCDRFGDATIAYQGYGRGLDLQFVAACAAAAAGGRQPDLTLLLDVPWETARARLSQRGRHADRLEAEDERFHRRVRDGYLTLAQREPARIVVLDASLDPAGLLDQAWVRLAPHLATP